MPRKTFRTQIKECSEIAYWRWQHFRQKGLHNRHYAYFFTDYFNLSLDDYRNKKILDLGCGPRGSLEWAQMASERVGLDPLADSYRKLGADKHRMKYVKAYSENMPFNDGYFDVISSFNSLDHVESLHESCREIDRVLKPGGLFLCIVDIHSYPTLTEPQSIPWDLASKFFPDYEVLMQKRLKQNHPGKIYKALRDNIDLEDEISKNGVLVLKIQKPA